MLTVIDEKGHKYVRLAEFYDKLDLSRDHYRQFVRRTIVNHQIPKKGVDFIQIRPKTYGPGQPRKDYLISMSFLKTLCFELNSVRSKEVKDWADDFRDFVMV